MISFSDFNANNTEAHIDLTYMYTITAYIQGY
jgi:hypothetical protein